MAKKVLITGITGFLGSELAAELISHGYEVAGLKRITSNLERCREFEEKVVWVDRDQDNWKQLLISFRPEIILHAAWDGVGASDRDNWSAQLKNLELSLSLLEIAKEVKAEKMIGFGSQAEYGYFSGKIDENYLVQPNSAYGLAKNMVSNLIKTYSNQNGIDWIWLRLFSFFGEKEADNWFIPSVIKNVYENKPMDMTPGLQKYAYMYVKDLSRIVRKIVETKMASDIYNLSSSNAYELRSIVERIIEVVNPTHPRINFGALPYRENQPMLIQGETDKLMKQIGNWAESDFNQNLRNVVEYKIKKLKGKNEI